MSKRLKHRKLPSKMHKEDARTKPRAILTREIARDIYRYKIENMEAVASAVGRHACMLAGMYGVSEKTIRDIWTARTWSEETIVLDPARRKKSANERTSPSRLGENSAQGKDLCEQVGFHDACLARMKDSKIEVKSAKQGGEACRHEKIE